MSSSLFSIARTALITQQRVLDTVGQNIANAETPGYSRQEAVLSAATPIWLQSGMVGTGVQVSRLERKRDILLDDTYRTANGTAGETTMRRDTLTEVQNIFGEPTDAGMSSALDGFFNAWSDLASTPSSQANRAIVQQSGTQLAALFNSYNDGLNAQRSNAVERLTANVGKINQLASEVAGLNGQIAASEVGGDKANDLRDQRDMMLDQLSGLAGTHVVPQADGTMTVLVGNSTLVDGTTSRPLTLVRVPENPPSVPPNPDTPVSVRLGDSIDSLKPLGGENKSLVDALNTDIPGIRGRLNKMASSLVSTVNALHTQGYTFVNNQGTGTAAGNFFDPGTVSAPVTAASIKLDTAILGNVDLIASGNDAAAPLNNTIATGLAGLRNTTATVTYNINGTTETGSFLGFFRQMVTRLGLDVSHANDDATVATTLTDQAQTRRQSVSGVNSDEELIQMVRVQQAYVAATKLIKSADEMLQTVLGLI